MVQLEQVHNAKGSNVPPVQHRVFLFLSPALQSFREACSYYPFREILCWIVSWKGQLGEEM